MRCALESGGAQKSIKCVKTDVIKWATYPSWASPPLSSMLFIIEKVQEAHPGPVYVG